MKPMPAKVKSGLLCVHHAPDQLGKLLGIMATLPWRTATPLGRPVVPDVYMMSARSPAPTGTWKAESSAPSISSHAGPPVETSSVRLGTAAARADAASASAGENTRADASAWFRRAWSSVVVNRALRGTATGAALCAAA